MPGTTIDHLRRQIQRLLKQNGATQAQLAAAVGHSAAWLSMILRGRRKIQISEIDKIAAFLEVMPARLFDDPDHEPILLRAVLEKEAKSYATSADSSGSASLIQRLQQQREIIAQYAQTIARQQQTIDHVLSHLEPAIRALERLSPLEPARTQDRRPPHTDRTPRSRRARSAAGSRR